MFSSSSTEAKLAELENQLQSLKNQKSMRSIILTLNQYSASELNFIFDEGPEVMTQLKKILDLASEVITGRIKDRFDEMLNDKNTIADANWQGFGSEESLKLSEFLITFWTELIITFTLQ